MSVISQYQRNGFTLIELVIVIAIVGTVALFASSAASAAINASRTSNSVSSLFAALTRARSAAATAGVDVVLCPSSDGVACSSGYHWEAGWIAFSATHAGSDGHFLQDAREDFAALRVGSTLLVLDRAPFAMAGHWETP